MRKLAGVIVLWLAACEASSPTARPDTGAGAACTTETDCAAPAPYCEPTTSTCVECRFASHCGEGVCEAQRCRAARSCKELHEALPGLPSGAYTIDPDDAGTSEPLEVYCDMTTSGGGWTALLNPTTLSATSHPALMSAAQVLSGTQSCAASTVPTPFTANGWRGLRAYACGDVTFKLTLTWANTLAATEAALLASVQGETTRTVMINSASVGPASTGTDAGGATCAFYNGTGATAAPATNDCHQTSLDAPPQVVTTPFAGNLTVEITTGPACAPTCAHGTGMNIQKLFVR